ncbi:hypothetical protein DFH28DRAFT_1079872 [Melampsora americana]|nr:hypothetical protein DFH28DRAFT_1079872 [Melampsora americana]
MLFQFHHILILVIAAEGMFLPHHGEDDPRTALSFTALLEGDKAENFILQITYSIDFNLDGQDHVNWKSEESFIKKPEQERRKSSPREEVLNGEEIVTRKEVQKSDSKSDLLKETPHITLENTPESTRRRTTTNINDDSSQSEKDHESSGIEASSSHGTSVGDHAGLFENGNGEDHEKSQKDISLEDLQEPWFYEHDLMGADAMRAESTLMDIDLSKDSDPNSLIATWSSWDTSYNHHQDPGDNLMVHRPSASPSQSQENPTEIYAHETPVDTSSSLHQTPEVNVLGHKRPFLNEDPEEEMHEAKRLKMFDFNSFPFDLTVRVA